MRGSFLSASGRGSWSLSFQNKGRQHAVYRDFHKAISTRITNPVATISNVQAGIEMGSGRTRKGRNPDAVKGRAPIRPRASSVQGQTAINDASCRQLLRQNNRRSHSRAGKHASGRCASLQPKRQWRRGAVDRRCPRTAARRPLCVGGLGRGVAVQRPSTATKEKGPPGARRRTLIPIPIARWVQTRPRSLSTSSLRRRRSSSDR